MSWVNLYIGIKIKFAFPGDILKFLVGLQEEAQRDHYWPGKSSVRLSASLKESSGRLLAAGVFSPCLQVGLHLLHFRVMPMSPTFKEGREILHLSSFGQHCQCLDSVNGARQGGSCPRAMVLLGRLRGGILMSRGWWHLGSKCVLCLVESDAAVIKNVIKMLLGFHMFFLEFSPAIFCFI